MKKYFFAFTIAEILVTLGIIGIVAAMTIPSLLTRVNEQHNITRLKQTYSLLYQALKLAENDGGDFSALQDLDGNYERNAADFVEMLRPHLKILSDCGHEDTNEVCVQNQYYIQLNGQNRLNYANNRTTYKLVLMNGTHIWLAGGRSNYAYTSGTVTEPEYLRIYVDTNGLQGPNQWGRDFFMLHYYGSLGLIPAGQPGVLEGESEVYESDSCMLSSTGVGCAYYVIKYGNMSYLHR